MNFMDLTKENINNFIWPLSKIQINKLYEIVDKGINTFRDDKWVEPITIELKKLRVLLGTYTSFKYWKRVELHDSMFKVSKHFLNNDYVLSYIYDGLEIILKTYADIQRKQKIKAYNSLDKLTDIMTLGYQSEKKVIQCERNLIDIRRK
jgi:uncharacterized membrane protein YukC